MDHDNSESPGCSHEDDDENVLNKGDDNQVPVRMQTVSSSTAVISATVAELEQQSERSIAVPIDSSMSPLKAARLILIHRPSLMLSKESTIMHRPFRIFSNLPSQNSLIIANRNTPESLFFLAFAKLNNSALSLLEVQCIQRRMQSTIRRRAGGNDDTKDVPDLSPPDSVMNAPPSYSFVLRQIARRRPRLLGTFIPSPSFILPTPPPNYGAAFDVFDSRIPQPIPRIYNFGYVPMPAVCHECGYGGLTVISSRITICTHLTALFLCLICCWLCAPLPYILRSCKDVYHYCSNCRTFLGMYCRTNQRSVRR